MENIRKFAPALGCGALVALCILITRPFVEMGQCDDFAYVRTAKHFAETGHVFFYGWASAMLGWQIALGALFIKLFGFSFSVANSAVLIVAVATAILIQRTGVHMGLTESNAVFATLSIVLSPLFLPLSFSFMSDIPGMFAIVTCMYCCTRAVRSTVPSHTSAWLISAAISSAMLGTARQTGWLGLFLIVPSTLWIVRRRDLPIVRIAGAGLLCVGFVMLCLRWFSRQMYATVESTADVRLNSTQGIVLLAQVFLDTAFFLVPISAAFFLPFARRCKGLLTLSLGLALLFCIYLTIRPDSYWGSVVIQPALNSPGNYVTSQGLIDLPEIGARPAVLSTADRVAITVICYLSSFAFLALFIRWLCRTAKRESRTVRIANSGINLEQILAMLGPFILGYCLFLGFRAFSSTMFDRYMLPLFVAFALIGLRFYQDQFGPKLPRTCFAVLFLFVAYAVCGFHDAFAENRARLAAAEQLRAAGVQRTSFYAGFPYDGWTQIDSQGYVDVGSIRTPAGVHKLSYAREHYRPCHYFHAGYFPAIHPQYVLSYDNYSCGETQQTFAPIHYRLWLPPFSGAIYTRKVTPRSLGQPGSQTTKRAVAQASGD